MEQSHGSDIVTLMISSVVELWVSTRSEFLAADPGGLGGLKPRTGVLIMQSIVSFRI